MALSNSQYDAIMRAYGRQQIEDHHQLEERRQEIQEASGGKGNWKQTLPAGCLLPALESFGGRSGALTKLKEDLVLQDLRSRGPYHPGGRIQDNYLELWYKCPTARTARIRA